MSQSPQSPQTPQSTQSTQIEHDSNGQNTKKQSNVISIQPKRGSQSVRVMQYNVSNTLAKVLYGKPIRGCFSKTHRRPTLRLRKLRDKQIQVRIPSSETCALDTNHARNVLSMVRHGLAHNLDIKIYQIKVVQEDTTNTQESTQ